jgi:saccharopine dehydrogenase-like NADP-dependent oxidoreductase
MQEAERLDQLVSEHDVIVSLVPAPCHPAIARLAIKHHKNMVTASYISPEMRALHEEAVAAHIVILNESGLDPGIDHMSAKKMIDEAIAAGGTITGFTSVCGGLPAPEAANNPLGYKFSWSPRGALVAARNSARYLQNGKVVEVPGEALLASASPL